MKILALDTATDSFSVAVADTGRLLSEKTGIRARSHSGHLLDTVNEVLALAEMPLSALEGIAVTLGPGSFTGIRIGLAVAKGLAMALNLPMAGAGTLEVLARQISGPLPVWAALDARRGEVYAARFVNQAGDLVQDGPALALNPENWLGQVEEESLFVGDWVLAHQDSIRARLGDLARFAPAEAHRIQARTVAERALELFRAGLSSPPEAILPLYVRPPDAKLPGRSFPG